MVANGLVICDQEIAQMFARLEDRREPLIRDAAVEQPKSRQVLAIKLRRQRERGICVR